MGFDGSKDDQGVNRAESGEAGLSQKPGPCARDRARQTLGEMGRMGVGSPRGAGDVEPERSKGLRPGSGPDPGTGEQRDHSFIHSFIVEPPCPPPTLLGTEPGLTGRGGALSLTSAFHLPDQAVSPGWVSLTGTHAAEAHDSLPCT